MRAWKHILLLVGVLGVSGMFAPMLEVKQGRYPVEFSARQLTFGLEKPRSIIDRKLPKVIDKRLPTSVRTAHQDARLVSEISKWAAIVYVPSALLLLWGLIGILRRRFGRVLGALAVLAGLGSIGAWLGLHFGIQIALEEAELKGTSISLMLGAHLLLLVGIAGVLAGVGALIRPDLGRRPPATAHPPAHPPPGPGHPPPGYPPPGYPPPGPPPGAGYPPHGGPGFPPPAGPSSPPA